MAGACVLFFVVLEGISSTIFALNRVLFPRTPSRTLAGRSVRYDAELGWTPVPNFRDRDYYAPGTGLRINSQGFRCGHDVSEQIPGGKVRILCSGASFTFGDGVDNTRTWLQILETRDGRFEAVNMAETGYALDQMYLWYKRHRALHRDVHLFSFTTDNVRCMQLTSLAGYEKPVVKLRGGELVVENVPAPRRSRMARWFALQPHPLLEFRSFALAKAVVDRARGGGGNWDSAGAREALYPILDKMIGDLARMDKAANSVTVLVYLPTRGDYGPGGSSDSWRRFFREEASKTGIRFIDLIEDFQKLPVTTKDGMFIWPGFRERFTETPGHYDDQGNEYIGETLYKRLISLPEVKARLAAADRAAPENRQPAGSTN